MYREWWCKRSYRLKWNSFSSSRVWYLVYVCRPRFRSKTISCHCDINSNNNPFLTSIHFIGSGSVCVCQPVLFYTFEESYAEAKPTHIHNGNSTPFLSFSLTDFILLQRQTHHLGTHRTGCASRGRGDWAQGHPGGRRGARGLAETVENT